jgi:hypothetical protein
MSIALISQPTKLPLLITYLPLCMNESLLYLAVAQGVADGAARNCCGGFEACSKAALTLHDMQSGYINIWHQACCCAQDDPLLGACCRIVQHTSTS